MKDEQLQAVGLNRIPVQQVPGGVDNPKNVGKEMRQARAGGSHIQKQTYVAESRGQDNAYHKNQAQ